MKNFGWAFCIFGLLSLSFTSCTKSSSDEWRDNNLRFFDNLKGKANVLEIGDSINGYAGLFYTVEHMGTGPKPVIGNNVKVIYAGYTWNDTLKYNSPLDIDNAFDYESKGSTFKVGNSTIEGSVGQAFPEPTISPTPDTEKVTGIATSGMLLP